MQGSAFDASIFLSMPPAYDGCMQSRRVTITDIAQELSLSVGTVSNALNGKVGQVSKETVERVLETARRMGYTRNPAAAALRSGRSHVVSLHVPPSVRSLSFYMEFTVGVVNELADRDLDVLMVTGAGRGGHQRQRVDGTIVVDWLPHQDWAEAMRADSGPVVCAGRPPVRGASPDRVVEIDYPTLVRQMMDRTIQDGAQRPLMIAPDRRFQSSWAQSIEQGFRTAVSAAGHTPVVVPAPVDATADEILNVVDLAVSQDRPDAILFGPQRFAGIAHLARGWGRADSEIPWVASCAGDPLSELGVPGITAIDTRPRDFGARCAQELWGLLSTGTPVASTEDVDESRLVQQPADISWSVRLRR